MSADPFAFLRGANAVYWHDLGMAKALKTFGGTSGTRTWLQGDMHVANLGSFADDREKVVYDLNDFDEAILGDYQLDVWRMTLSLVLLMRVNQGFSTDDETAAVATCAGDYLLKLARQVAAGGDADQVFTASNTYGRLDDFLKDVTRDRSPARLLQDFTTLDRRGVRHFQRGRPDLVPASRPEVAAITDHWDAYQTTITDDAGLRPEHFTPLDICRRLHAGIGSLGLRRYFVLIAGSPHSGPVILDLKEQPAPSAYGYFAADDQAVTQEHCAGHHGRRVVQAARALGHAADDFLGWMTFSGKHWSVRRRSPWKDELPTDKLTRPKRIRKMAEQWGAILATAHCRGDPRRRRGFDQAVVEATDGQHRHFLDHLEATVLPYADRVHADYRLFYKAWTAGRITAD